MSVQSGVVPGLRPIVRLNAANFRLVVMADQSGNALGAQDVGMLARIHARMHNESAREGGHAGTGFHCPHDIDDDCAFGVQHDPARRLGIDLRGIPCAGVFLAEVEAVYAAGVRPILLRGGGHADTPSVVAGVGAYGDMPSVASALIGVRGAE